MAATPARARRSSPAGIYLACARSANAGRRCPRERGGPGPRLVHTPSDPSGSQRSPAVSSGKSFAQVAGAILRKQARGQNPDKDEAAGSSPARPTNRPVTSADAGSSASRRQSNRMHPVRDEVLRVIAVLSRNSGSEQRLCAPTVVGLPQMVSRTAVSEPIPVFRPSGHQVPSDTLLGVTLEMELRPADARGVQLTRPRRGWYPARCPGAAAGASPGGLEQFDHVAGGVLQQDLGAARSGDDVVAEPAAGGAEPVDLAGQVGDL